MDPYKIETKQEQQVEKINYDKEYHIIKLSSSIYSSSFLGDGNLDLCSLYELAECLYPKGTRELEERLAIELVLSSASRCHHCAAILYDEEIMAGWQPEDSNLNTVCQYCDKATVPLLTATILDYR